MRIVLYKSTAQASARWTITSYAVAIAAALSGPAFSTLAADATDPRRLALSEINQTPVFIVRVDVDHPNHVYREGETIQVSVRSERQGHLYLFYCDARGQVSCVFPNQVQRDNFIPADQTIVVPDTAAKFRLRVGPPLGSEVLKAVVATQPLKSLELDSLIKGDATPLNPAKLKAIFVEVNGGDPSAAAALQDTQALKEQNLEQVRQWSEHHVPITTVANDGELPQRLNLEEMTRIETTAARPQRPAPASLPSPTPDQHQPKRVGVFIGIRNYLDPGIRPLIVADRDAQTFAAAMKQFGALDEGVLLINEQATLLNIETVIRRNLPAATSPGDLVFLYWSGHGGRTSNLDGTEPDGYDEYLVPYDGRLEPANAIRRTMLLDKTFGRWVQELDGRKLVFIIDACHSGGQTQGAIKALTGGDAATPFRKFFYGTTWQRTKDIGQRETAVLASSRGTQVSFERRQGDLSVMTHFLVDFMSSSSRPVTLVEAADYVKSQVPTFVEKHYPGTTQTPVFVDQTTPPIYLRP